MRRLALQLLGISAAHGFSLGYVQQHRPPCHVPCRAATVSMAASTGEDAESATLLTLLDEKRLGAVCKRAFEEPQQILELLKDAGFAGVLAYAVVFVTFYSIAVPIGEVGYHLASGRWVDPRVLLEADGAAKAEALALIGSFYLLCKPLAPVRLGGALLLTPDAKRFVERTPWLRGLLAQAAKLWEGSFGRLAGAGEELEADATSWAPTEADWAAARRTLTSAYPPFVQRAALRAEVVELAARASGGARLAEADEARLLEIITSQLPALNPTPEPARSAKFSGEWECVWTTEKELNFVVEAGLLGLPWQRTYQTIDVGGGRLTNVIDFDGGQLSVDSSIAPDEADGSRFNFAFDACALRYRSLRVPLPPVGRGWGELLYLDDEMRIQRDIRGDLLVAKRAKMGRKMEVNLGAISGRAVHARLAGLRSGDLRIALQPRRARRPTTH